MGCISFQYVEMNVTSYDYSAIVSTFTLDITYVDVTLMLLFIWAFKKGNEPDIMLRTSYRILYTFLYRGQNRDEPTKIIITQKSTEKVREASSIIFWQKLKKLKTIAYWFNVTLEALE